MSLFDTGRDTARVSLNDLLQIEDSPDLLALVCPQTGIPVWSVLRIAFLRRIMGDLLFGTGSLAPPAGRRSPRAAVSLGRMLLHNATATIGTNLSAEILLHTDTIGDTLRGGRWFNRYADPFGDRTPGRAVMLTDLHDWQLNQPRHNERIIYHGPVQVAAALAGRVPGSAVRALAQAVTRLACDRARQLTGWEMTESHQADFANWAAGKIAGLPLRYAAYRRWLRRVRPQLLLGLACCYGANAPLLAAARDAGIITAEFQHGSISAGHDAYNFAPAVFVSDAFRRTLPQYLLTYGSWWSEQVTAPVECVVIGNPTRSENMVDRPAPISCRSTILVLGDGIEFDRYLGLAQAIAQGVAGTELAVALRPHPLERRSVLDRFGDRAGDVRMDFTPNIYASFAEAHTVVSEVSTGLFEAASLVDRIVMLDTAKARFAYPRHPFAAADSQASLIQWICGPTPPTPKIDEASLWAPGWEENYAWFLRNKVGIDASG